MVIKRVVSMVSLFVVIVSMAFIVFLNNQSSVSANMVSTPIYASEDTTMIYEGINAGLVYEDGQLGYLDVGYQGTFGQPIEAQVLLKFDLPPNPPGYEVESANLYLPVTGGNFQATNFYLKVSTSTDHSWEQDSGITSPPAPSSGSTQTRLLASTVPTLKPTLAPFTFTNYISGESTKANPTATFILSGMTAQEAAQVGIQHADHYIQMTETNAGGGISGPYLIITYSEIVNIEITGVTDGGIYNTNVTPHFNVGTATLNGSPFTSGTTVSTEGSYILEVTSGGQLQTIQFRIDKTPPTGTVIVNQGNQYTNTGAVNVSVTPDVGVTDITNILYSINGLPFTSISYVPVFLLGIGPVNGDKILSFKLVDGAGNESPEYQRVVTLDTVPPTGSVVINNGNAYTTSTAVTLNLALDSGVTDVVGVQYSNNNSNWTLEEPFSSTRSFTLSSGDGNKTVYVRLIDRAGNITVIQDNIILDTTPPTGTVVVNDGRAYTNNSNVNVNITPAAGVTDIVSVRYTLNGLPPTTIAYTDSFTINVGSTDGEKAITVELIDGAGHASPVYSATVTLDKVEPTGSITINGGAAYTISQAVTIDLALDADVDDVEYVRFSNDNLTWSDEESFSASMSYTLPTGDGSKTVYVRFIDRAGNIGTAQDSITLDTIAPTGTLSLTSPVVTNATNVTFTVTSSDADYMELGEVGQSYAARVAYSDSVQTYTLQDIEEDGVKTIQVRLSDEAGNTTVLTADVTLDRTAPTGTVVVNGGELYTNDADVIVDVTPATGVTDITTIRYTVNGTSTTIAYTDSFVIDVGSTNEEKEITVELIDEAGNVSPEYTSTVTLDTVPPTGTVVINGGAAYATAMDVTLSLTLGAGVTDVVGLQFSHDNLTWSTVQAYSSSISYTLPAGDGSKTVYVRFIDRAGNAGTAQNSITLDTVAPTGTLTVTSPMITNATSVTLTVTSSDADYMELGEVGQPYEARAAYSDRVQTYILQDTAEDGVKTIQVRLSDEAGNTTVLTVDVTLDQTAPTGTVVVNDGKLYTNDADVTVKVTPATGVTDIVKIRYTVNGTPTTIAYTDSFIIDVGSTNEEKGITVELLDEAGNASPAYTATITLDNVAPTGTVAINGGAAYTSSTGVTLKFTLGAGVADVVGVQFSNDNLTWSTEQAYSPSMSYTLSAGEGSKTVYVRFIDRAGNVSEVASASIVYRSIPVQNNSTGSASEGTGTTPENSVSANVMMKFGEKESASTFTGQVHVQGSSIEVLFNAAQLSQLSKAHENETIELSLVGTYSKAVLNMSNEALDKLAANGNSLLFRTAGQQFILSSREIKQMLATSRSSFIISIKHESGEMLANAKEQAQKGVYQLIGVPITIDLSAQSDGNDSVHLQDLGTIVMGTTGAGELPSAVLKLLDNGVQSPVVAAISTNDQGYHARVTSYGSGTYTLIRKQPRFTDVSGWSLTAIDTLASKLILSGVNETTFEPKRAITRAEFATIINNALGLVETSGRLSYTDIVAGAWYSDAVAAVAELGFMNGYPDGTYRPAQQITREEAMVIVARVLQHLDSKKGISASEMERILEAYTDQSQISNWSRNDIALTVQAGIIMGDNGRLAVKDQITREQVAAIIVRLLEQAEIL